MSHVGFAGVVGLGFCLLGFPHIFVGSLIRHGGTSEVLNDCFAFWGRVTVKELLKFARVAGAREVPRGV
jgi:hypothetical protein